ncbi:Uncharacterized protein BM_BM1488 [Brugia malayi]|uniref:Bm1488 n=1 Tax=Brugia malayi TaxID=6279 RepID=A0A1U7F231_BRUMA|nr:Uncharacterized protein BM_BM1488 [Brugia malayi]CDQ00217.2 Bm1488 [Brugia malayi]VIO90984.1 Uncharacterized protein BM_BM1488 [Brugia malayi]
MHAYEENIQLYENFLPFCKLLNLCNNNVENAWNIFLKERIGIQQCMPLISQIMFMPFHYVIYKQRTMGEGTELFD